MSGIVNTTGAKSGVIGTIVGTPVTEVLQVIHGTPSTTAYASTSWTEVTCTNITNTINKSISGSSIIAIFSVNYQLYSNGSTYAPYLYLDFDRTSPSSATFGLNRAYMRDEDAVLDNMSYRSTMGGSFVDPSSATGDHVYVAHIRGGHPSSGTPQGNIDSPEHSTIMLMEVVT